MAAHFRTAYISGNSGPKASDVFDDAWTIARFDDGLHCQQCIDSIRALHLDGVEVERMPPRSMRFRAPGKVECGVRSVIGEFAGHVLPHLVLT